MPPTNPHDVRMSLGDHLEELRFRLILAVVGPLVASVVVFFFGWDIVELLIQPLAVALEQSGQEPQIHPRQIGEAFGVYLKVSFIGGLIIGIPWLVWQLWQFVAPGLYPSERKFITALLPGSVVLSITGVVFMYYVMLPFTLWFLVGFTNTFDMPSTERHLIQEFTDEQPPDDVATTSVMTEGGRIPVVFNNPNEHEIGDMWIQVPRNILCIDVGEQVVSVRLNSNKQAMTPVFGLNEYISFVLWTALAFAISFQLPLVMLLLAKIGIFDHRMMAGARQYALLGCFAIGAILTPADVMSMLALAMPMYLLYEFGLLLVKWFVGVPEPETESEPA